MAETPTPPKYDGVLVFQVYRSRDGFRWRLWSASKRRQIMADGGESYKTRNGATRSILSIAANMRAGNVRVEQRL